MDAVTESLAGVASCKACDTLFSFDRPRGTLKGLTCPSCGADMLHLLFSEGTLLRVIQIGEEKRLYPLQGRTA